MIRSKVLIGIDPDVEASGFAAINLKGDVSLKCYKFFELFDYLQKVKVAFTAEKVVVYVECGFLNKSNWHAIKHGPAAVNAQIGQRTGANHETAKKIVEMCIYLGLKYIEVKPTTAKVDSAYFKKLTGISKRTNQEQRDAYMLIFGRK